MGYISVLPKTYMHIFLPSNTLGYFALTETVINASRLIKKFDHCYIYSVVSVWVEVVCQKQQTLRLHFQSFYKANLFDTGSVYFTWKVILYTL